MGVSLNYKKEIINLTKELSQDKLKELIDFTQFLKAKGEGFTYMQVRDSAEYVRDLRMKEGKRIKSGKKFNVDIYCSVLSKKEILSKVGLSDSERKIITKPVVMYGRGDLKA